MPLSSLFSSYLKAQSEPVLPSEASGRARALYCKHLLTESHPCLHPNTQALGTPFLPPSTSGVKSESHSAIQMLAEGCQTSVQWKLGHREAYACLSQHIWAAESQGVRGPHLWPAQTRCPAYSFSSFPSGRINTGSLWSQPCLPSL